LLGLGTPTEQPLWWESGGWALRAGVGLRCAEGRERAFLIPICATVAGPTTLEVGRWDGTLLGGDFTGEFTAAQR
jgi:hypothetical protein